MELGLFTRGAYIWPVYRNFEAFIASLGVSGHDVARISDCPAYPVTTRTDSAVHGLSAEMDLRLTALHRELYDALLRPVEAFAKVEESFSGYFLADLQTSITGELLDAFMYYFTHSTARELSVVDGLTVLRGVFFNHEAVEPALWLHGSRERVKHLQRRMNMRQLAYTAPPLARLSDLVFCVSPGRNRPAGGSGWLTGRARRELDGRCHIQVEYGLDPSLNPSNLPERIARQLDTAARDAISTVFGWECGVVS